MRIAIGTSGFQYPEWRGKFYPSDLPTAKMLDYYTRHFETTESNYSFRRIPSPKTIANWFEKTPANFSFSLKAPQRITHFAKLRDCAELVDTFWSVVRELHAKLGPVLFQLPPTLHRNDELLEQFLRGLPEGMRAAFEFRHASWFEDETIAILKRFRCALCVAESSELATPRISTAGFGYLRLRREDYTNRELAKWAEWIRSQPWKEAFVYFKHEEKAVGPAFAAKFQELSRR